MKVGLIGYGTIGQVLATAIRQGRAGNTELIVVIDILEQSPFGGESDAPLYTTDVEHFLASDIELVIEAVSQSVLKKYAPLILSRSKDLMPMSVGAFSDQQFLDELRGLALKYDRHIFLPSGAIGGLDALSAAAIDEIDELILTTTKPPSGLKDLTFDPAVDLTTIDEATCIYDGPAEEAVRLLPKNVNVAAALSLAGIGFQRTRVRVVADPLSKQNTHRIEARGRFGELALEFRLHPSPTNPKTSYLAALSAISTLKKLTEPIRIGS